VGFVIFASALLSLVFFVPSLLGEPDNFMVANPLRTPAHIVPEWYFLFAYAILRSIPNKLGGVVGLFISILFFFFLPFLSKNYLKGNAFNPLSKMLMGVFVLSFVILRIGGAWPVEHPYLGVRRVFSLIYFSFFFLFSSSQKPF